MECLSREGVCPLGRVALPCLVNPGVIDLRGMCRLVALPCNCGRWAGAWVVAGVINLAEPIEVGRERDGKLLLFPDLPRVLRLSGDSVGETLVC